MANRRMRCGFKERLSSYARVSGTLIAGGA
jgi:hypothetical protein